MMATLLPQRSQTVRPSTPTTPPSPCPSPTCSHTSVSNMANEHAQPAPEAHPIRNVLDQHPETYERHQYLARLGYVEKRPRIGREQDEKGRLECWIIERIELESATQKSKPTREELISTQKVLQAQIKEMKERIEAKVSEKKAENRKGFKLHPAITEYGRELYENGCQNDRLRTLHPSELHPAFTETARKTYARMCEEGKNNVGKRRREEQ